MKKKKYNPFKMWGSYIGAFLGLITPTLFFYYIASKCTVGCGMLGIAFFPIQLFLLITIPVGFLIGWGIHSLIRKLCG